MKNILVLLSVGCLTFISMNAYFTTIQNLTDGEIKVAIQYGGKGVCSDEQKIIGKDQSAQIDTKICCTAVVDVLATSGKAYGRPWVRFNPPATGFGLSCRDFRIAVKNTADGGLVTEQA